MTDHFTSLLFYSSHSAYLCENVLTSESLCLTDGNIKIEGTLLFTIVQVSYASMGDFGACHL